MLQRDYLAVSQATDPTAFRDGLISFAEKMDFGLVGAVLMQGDLNGPSPVIRSVSNTPDDYVQTAKDIDQTRGDPVMQRLMTSRMPFMYDQDLYVQAGAGDVWEVQAPFGFRNGIAVALRLPAGGYFLLGMDRHERLPRSEVKLTRMLADLQLLAVHGQDAAQRLLVARSEVPQLTPRELEILQWTKQGKSAWAIAQLLQLSEATVRFHLANCLRKWGVNSKQTAVLKSIEAGLLD